MLPSKAQKRIENWVDEAVAATEFPDGWHIHLDEVLEMRRHPRNPSNRNRDWVIRYSVAMFVHARELLNEREFACTLCLKFPLRDTSKDTPLEPLTYGHFRRQLDSTPPEITLYPKPFPYPRHPVEYRASLRLDRLADTPMFFSTYYADDDECWFRWLQFMTEV